MSSLPDSHQPAARRVARQVCPICARPAVTDHLPFCSQTCRNRDLIAWLDEAYAIPVAPEEAPSIDD